VKDLIITNWLSLNVTKFYSSSHDPIPPPSTSHTRVSPIPIKAL
jgi:hypothetical protein